jgi:hypothetical protein
MKFSFVSFAAKGFKNNNMMKGSTLWLLIFLMLLIVISCHHNRLKTNEKELAKEIITQEKEKEEADKVANEKKLTDTLNRHQGGFRLKENRLVEPALPPIVINIAGSLNNVKEINLSDVAAGITYIRMEPIPDSALPLDLKFRYYLMANYIVAVNLYGIHLYAKDGRYIRSVVKNKFTGVEVHPGEIRIWDNYTMKGGGVSVWANGNNLYYNYTNNIIGQKYIMEYDCSSSQLTPDYKFDPEKPDQISGLGKIAIDLNHGKTEPPKPIKHPGLSGGSPESFFLMKSVFMLDQNSYALPARRDDNMMIILNNQGDTLSIFTKLEKLKNYTNPLQRGTDFGTQYEHNGKLYFRTDFNDTVFQVIPPNRLLPLYVLKLGNYKVSKQFGVDPDFKLTGKIIPGEWAETKEYIFITYSKDDYDCQNTRKNKTVKIYHAIFSKLNHQFTVIKGDPYDYSPEILENNIDGGLPVWPLSYMIGKDGEMLIPLKGKELKDRVKSEQFKVAKVPDAKKKELEKIARAVSNDEDILMIVK